MFAIYQVAGNSMLPQLKSGDYVVLLTLVRFISPFPGMKVVFNHPEYGSLLKEVATVDWQKKEISVQGLNPLSITARQLGKVPLSCVKGFVIWRIPCPQY